MIEQGKQQLKERLCISTFSVSDYFSEVKSGCYQVDSDTFKAIIDHPSMKLYYARRCSLQSSGGLLYVDPSEYYTSLKSVSSYHLEFDNSVIIVREVQ